MEGWFICRVGVRSGCEGGGGKGGFIFGEEEEGEVKGSELRGYLEEVKGLHLVYRRGCKQ